jgi:hypothetical protein
LIITILPAIIEERYDVIFSVWPALTRLNGVDYRASGLVLWRKAAVEV